MAALYAHLVVALTVNFKADTQSGSRTLANSSVSAGLFLGLPVFGQGIPRGAVVTDLSPLTLSLPATANALQVSLLSGFQYTGRRLKFTKDVPQPALFIRSGDDHIAYQGLNEILTIGAEVWVSSSLGANPDFVPETALNNLLDAVRAAMAPDDQMRQRFTLGGAVHWCRMLGKVEKDTGDLGDLAIAAADIEIIVP